MKRFLKRLALISLPALVVGLLIAQGVGAQVDQKFLDAWDVVKAKVESLLPASSEKLPSVEELQAKSDGVLGGTGEQASTRNVTGLYDLTLKDSDSSENDFRFSRRQFSGTIGVASSTFLSIRNTTGHDIYIQSAMIRLFGDASSTVRLGIGTNANSGFNYNTAWASIAKDVFGGIVATSTGNGVPMATTTAGEAITFSDNAGVATTEWSPWTKWSPNQYLVGSMQEIDPKWAVTSTGDRGFSESSYYLINFYEIATST